MPLNSTFINGKPIKTPRKDKSWLGPPPSRGRSHAQSKVPAPTPIDAAAVILGMAAKLREPERALPQPSRTRLLEASSEKRKMYPITSGVLDYFPDAIAAVAEVSFQGNQKHNPGEPLHWARGKSMDHADCIARHLVERGGVDGNILHTAALAWRSLALLQEELEKAHGLAPPRGASQI